MIRVIVEFTTEYPGLLKSTALDFHANRRFSKWVGPERQIIPAVINTKLRDSLDSPGEVMADFASKLGQARG